MTVLDASAVLALLHDEPGADIVVDKLGAAILGATNMAEVLGKLVDVNTDVGRVTKKVGGGARRRWRRWSYVP